jgi:hypothetical protein
MKRPLAQAEHDSESEADKVDEDVDEDIDDDDNEDNVAQPDSGDDNDDDDDDDDQDDDEDDDELGDVKIQTKPLEAESVEQFSREQRRRGVLYLGRVPPHMKPEQVWPSPPNNG